MLRIILILLLGLSAMPVWSQAIFQPSSISGTYDDYAYSMTKDADGNTYYSIREYWSYDSLDVFGKKFLGYESGNVFKFKPDGSYAWSLKLPADQIDWLHVDKGGFLYAISVSYWGAGQIFRIDNNGTLLGTLDISGARRLRSDKQGNLIVAGKNYVAKYTSTAEKLWELTFNPHLDNPSLSIDVDNNGNIVVAGDFVRGVSLGDYFYESDNQTNGAFVAKINSSGLVQFVKFFGASSTLNVYVKDSKIDPASGDIYFTGSVLGSGNFEGEEVKSKGESDFYIAKIDREGVFKWLKYDGSFGPDYGSSMVISKDYVYATGRLYGNIKMDNAQVGYIIGPSTMMARFNKTTGRASWIKSISPSKQDDASYKPLFIEEIEPKTLKMTGMFHGMIVTGLDTLKSKNEDIFSLTVLDTLSTGTTAQLKGKVVASQNSSCDTIQVGIPNMVIKAMPGPVYAMTNEKGMYSMNLPVGTYSISQVLPKKRNMVLTQVCPAATPKVVVKEAGEKLNAVSFANYIKLLPYLEVDVATDRFRRCFRNDMVVRYANDGLASISNVVVKVEFPEHVLPLSSTVPWTSRNGQTLTFKIGTLQAGQRGVIHITDSVRCGDETIRGATQCVYASISPANNAEVDPLWDRSEIDVLAKCLETGFVRLGIKNIGTGAMKDSALYRIYSNDQVAFESKYKLSPGDSLSMQIPSSGRTIRIEAYTTVNSPKTLVSDAVEGCGRVVAASIDLGFVNAFPQNDEEVELEAFCSEIVDSFDPNDKQVFPSGITNQHNIVGDEELEYLVRFQNTGTDVAYNIIIRDKLDPNVDLATLNIGAASHKYSVKIEGEGNPEIVWTFKNIMLPDSGRNEPGSHGFVKYKIKPLKDLARGTVIRNKAEIYFDYNSPVITNEVFNTIGLPDLTRKPTVVQDCNKDLRVEAGEDDSKAVCDLSSVVLTHQRSDVGYGQWKVLEGSGEIIESGASLEIRNLFEGDNVFEYSLTYCNSTDKRTLSVSRTITPGVPEVQAEYLFCSAALSSASIDLTGTNLTWFEDAELKKVLQTGNSFRPTGTNVVFVTDEQNECVSAAAVVKVVVNESPLAPSAKEAEGCANSDIRLSAAGNEIVWYREPGATEVAYRGNSIEARFNSAGEHQLFAATTLNGCESERIPVAVNVKGYDRKEIFIQNVITPNGDGLNDAFYLRADNFDKCAGNFRRVIVYNRLGETLFSSRDPNFEWDGNVSTGVYFYSLAFDNGKFEGTISVQK